VAAYRDHWHITHPDSSLGSPASSAEQEAQRQLPQTAATAATQISQENPQGTRPAFGQSLGPEFSPARPEL
jgi:hypothetical protein